MGCAGDLKALGLRPGVAGADASGSGLRVDDPDGFNAHPLVVDSPALRLGVCVLGRQNFDDKDWSRGENTGLRSLVDENQVRDPDTGLSDAGTPFRSANDTEGRLVLHEPGGQQHFHTTVLPTSHVALQNFAVDVFTVGAVARCKVFSNRDHHGSGHGILALTAP